MNHEQQNIIEATEPQIIVAAGPGSGKTHTLTQRIAALIRNGTNPAGIVCITFTNAGAAEMRHRLAALGIKRLGHLGTLHSYCLRTIQANANSFGYPSRIEMIGEAESRRIMERIANQNRRKLNVTELRQELRWIAFGEKPRTPSGVMAAAYLRLLRCEGLIDFETALLEMRRCAWTQKPIDHLIVDEAQDSGPLDWDIYDALPARNRFFVGDPDQSIYGFRGANVLLFEQRARSRDWQLYKLETNHRSVPAICNVAQNLIRKNDGRIEKEMVPAKPDGMNPRIKPVAIREFATDAAETGAILEWVQELQKQGVEAGEIAVLYRKNEPAISLRAIGRKIGLPMPPEALRRPLDWQRACAAMECLRNPASLSAYMRFSENIAAEKSAAALEQRTITLNVPKNATTGNVGALLAQMGISPESVQEVERIVATMPDAELIEIAAEMQRAPEEEHSEGLHFGTIHSSKGREWNHVWLAGFEQSEMPGKNPVAEERRIAFVGITRARKELVLSYANQRTAYGKTIATQPSQFLKEVEL